MAMIRINAGDDEQAAFDALKNGDTLEYSPGLTGCHGFRSFRVIEDITVKGNGAVIDNCRWGDGVRVENVQGFNISGLTVRGAPTGSGLRVVAALDVTVDSVRCFDSMTWGLFFAHFRNVKVTNCEGSGSKRQHGFYGSNSSYGYELIDCVANGNCYQAFHFNGDRTQPDVPPWNTFTAQVEKVTMLRCRGTGNNKGNPALGLNPGGASINMDGVWGAEVSECKILDSGAAALAVFGQDARRPSKNFRFFDNEFESAVNCNRPTVMFRNGASWGVFWHNKVTNYNPERPAVSFNVVGDPPYSSGVQLDYNLIVGDYDHKGNDWRSISLAGFAALTGMERNSSATVLPTAPPAPFIPVPAFAAELSSVLVPPVGPMDSVYDVVVNLENTGTEDWQAGEGAGRVLLGTSGALGRDNPWSFNTRVPLVAGPVKPGEVGTFRGKMVRRASIPLELEPLCEGREWFGDEAPAITIPVRATLDVLPPVPPPPPIVWYRPIGGTWFPNDEPGGMSQAEPGFTDPRKLLLLGRPTGAVLEADARIDADMTGDERAGIAVVVGDDGHGYNILLRPGGEIALLDDRVQWGPKVGLQWVVGVWYSMRLEASGGLVRGKVWRSGDPEPAKWLLEMPTAGRTGQYPAYNGGCPAVSFRPIGGGV